MNPTRDTAERNDRNRLKQQQLSARARTHAHTQVKKFKQTEKTKRKNSIDILLVHGVWMSVAGGRDDMLNILRINCKQSSVERQERVAIIDGLSVGIIVVPVQPTTTAPHTSINLVSLYINRWDW